MARAHSLLLTTVAISVSQASIVLPPPLPMLPPEAAYALRSTHQNQPYSLTNNDLNERISKLQLLSHLIAPELINKQSKKRHGDRAMLYEPMLPWVEKDLPPSHNADGKHDDSEEELNLNAVIRYDSDDDDYDDGGGRQRNNHHGSSVESLESESIEQPEIIERAVSILNANNIEDAIEGLKAPSSRISNLQLLSPILVPDRNNKKSKHRHDERARSYEPMLPLVEREQSFLQPPRYTIGNNEVSEEEPNSDLLLPYDEDKDDYSGDDDDDDNRPRKKYHRTRLESLESESTESGHGTKKRTVSTQKALNSTEIILEKLKAVCAHFPMGGSRLDDEDARVKGLVVPGLMSLLCKMLLRETGYSPAVRQALELYTSS